MIDPTGEGLIDEIEDVREVDEPDTGVPKDALEPSLDADMVELGPDTMESGVDMSTPDLGGGGLASSAPPASGGGGAGSGYVPPNSEEYFEGSGFLDVFNQVVDDESSPFAVAFDHGEGAGSVARPDGTLYFEETEEGLAFQYVGENFADPDYPVDEKAFEGQNLDLGEVRITSKEVGEGSSYGGREIESGSYRFLSSEDTPFDVMMGSVGSTLLGLSFEITDAGDVKEFAEEFSALEYDGEFEMSYGEE
jgi:hypothetical protein